MKSDGNDMLADDVVFKFFFMFFRQFLIMTIYITTMIIFRGDGRTAAIKNYENDPAKNYAA